MTLDEMAKKLGMDKAALLDAIELDGIGKVSGIPSQVQTYQRQIQEKDNMIAEGNRAMAKLQQDAQLAAAVFYQQQGRAPTQWEWSNDPLLAPVAQAANQIESRMYEIQANLEQANRQLADQFTRVATPAFEQIDKMSKRFLKMDNPDFDEERVRTFAKERGLPMGITWEDAYLQEKASRLPEIMSQQIEAAKAEGMKAASEKLSVPHTETESLSPQSSPPERTHDYEAIWNSREALGLFSNPNDLM